MLLWRLEKFYNMPCVSWGTRKARSIIQSESKGLRTSGANGSLRLKAWEPGGPLVVIPKFSVLRTRSSDV